MRPKKAKELIAEVASELNVSPDLVKDVTSFYWGNVRKSLSSLSYPIVHISSLGDFYFKNWKLEEEIKKYQDIEKDAIDKNLTNRFSVVERLFELKNMKSLIEEETQRKQFLKLHKKVCNDKYNSTLEK